MCIFIKLIFCKMNRIFFQFTCVCQIQWIDIFHLISAHGYSSSPVIGFCTLLSNLLSWFWLFEAHRHKIFCVITNPNWRELCKVLIKLWKILNIILIYSLTVYIQWNNFLRLLLLFYISISKFFHLEFKFLYRYSSLGFTTFIYIWVSLWIGILIDHLQFIKLFNKFLLFMFWLYINLNVH